MGYEFTVYIAVICNVKPPPPILGATKTYNLRNKQLLSAGGHKVHAESLCIIIFN